MIGVFRERFFTFRMKLKMFITSSDHYLKYLAILFLVKASGLGDFVSQNPLFSYGVALNLIRLVELEHSPCSGSGKTFQIQIQENVQVLQDM